MSPIKAQLRRKEEEKNKWDGLPYRVSSFWLCDELVVNLTS
jgi:hypothetical protein